MACGTPMISFNIGGVPELVGPEITGYLAQPENAKDLCNGIIQLLEDEKLRHQMIQNCRASVCRIFFRHSSQAIQSTVLSSFT